MTEISMEKAVQAKWNLKKQYNSHSVEMKVWKELLWDSLIFFHFLLSNESINIVFKSVFQLAIILLQMDKESRSQDWEKKKGFDEKYKK